MDRAEIASNRRLVEALRLIARDAAQLCHDANLISVFWQSVHVCGTVEAAKHHIAAARVLAEPDAEDHDPVTDEEATAYLERMHAGHREACGSFVQRHRAFAEAFRIAEPHLAGLVKPDGVAAGEWIGASGCEILDRVGEAIVFGANAGLLPCAGDFAGLDWGRLRVLVRSEVGAIMRLVGAAPVSPMTPQHRALVMLAEDPSLADLDDASLAKRFGIVRTTLHKITWSAVRATRDRLRQGQPPAGDVDRREPWQEADA